MNLGNFLNQIKRTFQLNSPESEQKNTQLSEITDEEYEDIPELSLNTDTKIPRNFPENETALVEDTNANLPSSPGEDTLNTTSLEPASNLAADANILEVQLTTEESLIISSATAEITPNFTKETNMINASMLQETLQNFVSGSSDVQGAVLVTPDGLALASVLSGDMDEERTAAMSASMLSLGERIGRELARGRIERIVVEGEKGYGVLVGCGSDAVFLVLANATAKQGILFLEVKRAVAQIAPLLG